MGMKEQNIHLNAHIVAEEVTHDSLKLSREEVAQGTTGGQHPPIGNEVEQLVYCLFYEGHARRAPTAQQHSPLGIERERERADKRGGGAL